MCLLSRRQKWLENFFSLLCLTWKGKVSDLRRRWWIFHLSVVEVVNFSLTKEAFEYGVINEDSPLRWWKNFFPFHLLSGLYSQTKNYNFLNLWYLEWIKASWTEWYDDFWKFFVQWNLEEGFTKLSYSVY